MAVKKYESKGAALTIEIDEDKCNADGECVNVCPTNVFEIIDEKSHATQVDESSAAHAWMHVQQKPSNIVHVKDRTLTSDQVYQEEVQNACLLLLSLHHSLPY